jgi:hypothetical protein
MACDGIYVRLEGGRDVCIPLYLAVQRRRDTPEPDDAGERNLRDLLALAAIQQIASELFDGDMRERIRDVVRTGLTTRYASQLPGGVTLGEELRERRS